MIVETEKQMQIRLRREAVCHYFYECGYSYFHIGKLLGVTMRTIHNDVIHLKEQHEEAREGRARLAISLEISGRIQDVVDRTLTDTIRRMERSQYAPRQTAQENSPALPC